MGSLQKQMDDNPLFWWEKVAKRGENISFSEFMRRVEDYFNLDPRGRYVLAEALSEDWKKIYKAGTGLEPGEKVEKIKEAIPEKKVKRLAAPRYSIAEVRWLKRRYYKFKSRRRLAEAYNKAFNRGRSVSAVSQKVRKFKKKGKK